ncbi:MAG: 23S rRNA (guanosine(2251)-2'-O)-methyltransferase RlmB [Spirosomataceae bacterium]
MENRKRGGIGARPQSSAGGPVKYRYIKSAPRTQDKEALVFGVQSVLETLRSDKDIDKVMVQREFSHAEVEKLAKERDVPVQRVPVEKLNQITGKNHQGVIAFISAVSYAKLSNVVATAFESGQVPVVLMLDRVTDVRNFGAIARTAECMGVHGLVVPSRGGAAINSDAMKTSSGALNFIPVCREPDLVRAVEELKLSGFQVVSVTEKGTGFPQNIDFQIPTVLIMGSEEDGISDGLLERSDVAVRIPMVGQVSSLNVSVAAGMLLYELVRQKNQ